MKRAPEDIKWLGIGIGILTVVFLRLMMGGVLW
jgi:hypothetical protein